MNRHVVNTDAWQYKPSLLIDLHMYVFTCAEGSSKWLYRIFSESVSGLFNLKHVGNKIAQIILINKASLSILDDAKLD